jgi:hypothetical protein
MQVILEADPNSFPALVQSHSVITVDLHAETEKANGSAFRL